MTALKRVALKKMFLDLSAFDYPIEQSVLIPSNLAEEAYNRAQILNLQIGDTVVIKEPSGESAYTVEYIGYDEYTLGRESYIIRFGYDDLEEAYHGIWSTAGGR